MPTVSPEKKSTIFKPALTIILFCLCLYPTGAIAWWGIVHSGMANDTINFFPEHMRTDLFEVRLWINEPDQNRVISHVNIGECAWKIKKLAHNTIKMLRENEPKDRTFAVLGQATHYIQDLNCPHHGIGYYDEGMHESFEKKVKTGFWEDSDFDGFQYIVDYKYFSYNAARFSKRYIRYCNRLKYNPDYFDQYKKLIDPLWDHSVNDSIDYWLTILWDGLGEEKYKELGLPPKVGTRGEIKLKFPKVKSLWNKD